VSRYFTNLTIALLGGLVVVGSLTFPTSAAAWLAFGVAAAVLAISVVAQLDTKRGLAQRALDGLLAVLSVVLIVFSVVFAGATVTWLAFGLSLGFVAVAVVGLTWNEIGNWRSANGLAELHSFIKVQHPDLRAPTMAEAA
jgi:O-antigen/teichoic acid export membrane protein